jgi:hypothetical protein
MIRIRKALKGHDEVILDGRPPFLLSKRLSALTILALMS